jgi:hypothetical protein
VTEFVVADVVPWPLILVVLKETLKGPEVVTTGVEVTGVNVGTGVEVGVIAGVDTEDVLFLIKKTKVAIIAITANEMIP